MEFFICWVVMQQCAGNTQGHNPKDALVAKKTIFLQPALTSDQRVHIVSNKYRNLLYFRVKKFHDKNFRVKIFSYDLRK